MKERRDGRKEGEEGYMRKESRREMGGREDGRSGRWREGELVKSRGTKRM